VADASLAAMLGGAAAPVSLDQLGDVIASAAGDLNASANAGAQVDAASSARTAPIKELDVQLNPATLGGLSIEMRLSDGKLSVTIKADKADTMKLIESERDSISSKLTSLNFSVESLTVKASDAPSAVAPATDASNSGMASNGGAQQGQSGQTGDGAQSGGSLRGGANQGRQPAPVSDAFAEPGGVDNLGDVYV
jgi:chemotaxis protein MotD